MQLPPPPPSDETEVNPFPTTAHPNVDAITFSTSIASEAPLAYATFPFTDESGRSWKIKAYFSTSVYELMDASGVVVAGGPLSADELSILSKAAHQVRQSKKDPNVKYIQPVPVATAIGLALGFVSLYLSWKWAEENNQQMLELEIELDSMCKSQAVGQTAAAWNAAAIACPNRPFVRDGQVCNNKPILRESTSPCQGSTYQRCEIQC